MLLVPLDLPTMNGNKISADGTCQKTGAKSDVFKEPDGSIHYNGAFTKRATSKYSFCH